MIIGLVLLLELLFGVFKIRYTKLVFSQTTYPQPTATSGRFSPTPTPGAGGLSCTSTEFCQFKLCPTSVQPACSAACINGVCYLTNLTPVPSQPTVIACQTWGSWGACRQGDSNSAGGCASTNYYYTTRYCQNPSNSNQYQIACCNPEPTSGGGGGGGGSNPSPTPILCINLYYCSTSDYLCRQTANQYNINDFIRCGGSSYCPDDLSATNTSKVCYSNQSTCQTACNNLNPGSWVKIKEGSFVSKNNLSQKIPLSPVAYDSDDNTMPYFLIGDNNTDGVVLAPLISLNSTNPNAKTSPREYFSQYTSTNSFTINGFLNYLKSRKEVKTINDINDINSNGIYQINNLNINSVSNIFNQYHLLIIVNNQVNINTDFNPTKSIAIVSNTINFSSTTTQAKGIFIANQINTGSTTNQGLKIIGNLVALTSLNNQRLWSNPNRPSLFIVYKPQLYLDLLPYLSTSYYDWQQIE